LIIHWLAYITFVFPTAEREVGLKICRRSEVGGVCGQQNWKTERERRAQGGVRGQVFEGVLLRGNRRMGGRRHSHTKSAVSKSNFCWWCIIISGIFEAIRNRYLHHRTRELE